MGSAAPVVLEVVAVAASVVGGPEIGAAILGYADTIEAVAAGYSASTLSAVGAASVGAASGAISEAQKTGDPAKILEAAGVGAVTGAVGSEVGSEVTSATGSPIAGGAASGASKGFTQAELSGSNLQQALKQGEIGGATGAITAGISDLSSSAGVPKDVTGAVLTAAGPYIRRDVSSVFGGTSPTTPGGTTPSSTSLPSYISSGGGGSVLGQALTSGSPDISGTSGSTMSPGSEDSSGRKVWNVASLKDADQGGAA